MLALIERNNERREDGKSVNEASVPEKFDKKYKSVLSCLVIQQRLSK